MKKGKSFKQFWNDNKAVIELTRRGIPRKQRRKEAKALWKIMRKKNKQDLS